MEKIKHIKIYLFLLAIGFILFNRYVLTGDVIYRYQFVNVPQEYIKGADMINGNNPLENRTMMFPFNIASWLDLNWNFNGYDPFTYLIAGPKISQGATGFTRLDNRYFNGIIMLLKKQNFVQLTKLLQNNSFKYFVYRKDLSFSRFPDKTTYLYKESNLYYRYLLKNKLLIPFFDNKYFAIYVLKDVKPRIYIENVNTVATAHLVIPEFNIEIKNLRDKAVINFSDNYSQNWNLYMASNENIFFDSFGISSLWQKPIAENTHAYTQRNNFSNSWTIDRTDIQKNFPQSSYTINPDGSISVSLKLYYKPQFYFSLLMVGVIISYIVLAIFLFIHLKIFKSKIN